MAGLWPASSKPETLTPAKPSVFSVGSVVVGLCIEAAVEVDITGMNLDGDGVAEVDGRPVSVPHAISGERVEVRLSHHRDGTATGEVVRVIRPSPHRVAPACRHFGPCGGCAWQHIAYDEQLRIKQRMVQTLIDRGSDRLRQGSGESRQRPDGSEDRPEAEDPRDGPGDVVRDGDRLGDGAWPRVLPTLPTPAAAPGRTPWGYRNKVSFVFAPGVHGHGLVMGHYRRGSRSIVPVQECPVHAEAGNHFAFALHEILERARVPGSTPDGEDGVARHVVARVTEATGELLGTLVVTENVKPLRRVTSEIQKALASSHEGAERRRAGFHLNIHDRPDPFLFGRQTLKLFGAGEVRERVGGVSYLISPTSFFQTNVRAAEVLVREVVGSLADARFRRVLDLYSGVGLFALPLAGQGRSVTAVEENRHAMTAAASAMRLNRIPDQACRLVASRAEEAIARLGADWDAIILDPPRQGCPSHLLDWVLRTSRPPRIVYVSCNPETLALDLANVPAAGYRFERIQPVDMFPHTAHIETVVVLDRE
jgi:23S rRNA (uracil1939-C5)-methyltransferase